MKTYTIIISEAQREALLDLLVAVAPKNQDLPEHLEYWKEMLRQLPEDERITPGCLHGLCL